MSEPDVVLAYESSATPSTNGSMQRPPRRITQAEWMLVLATVIWGSSFALAKGSGEAINRAASGAGRESQHVLGPLLTLALRFTLSTLLWLLVMPAARRGWTTQSVRRGASLGVLLAGGLILQHVALDFTTEAVAAFLTSLTVVFVPLLLWILWRQKLAAAAWLGVALAFPGVWLMSGADASGLRIGIGEGLGVACAIVFAIHLPLINQFAKFETPYRMAAAQFATVAIVCWIGVAIVSTRIEHFDWHVFETSALWLNVSLLVIFPGVLSFGLANIFQPQVEPVRAVLVYLLEPIFAATFAWLWVGRTMTRGMVIGGALILAANAIVELWPVLFSPRRHGDSEEEKRHKDFADTAD